MSTQVDDNRDQTQAVSKVPDTYIILMVVALLAFLLTYLITPGSFSMVEQVQSNGEVTSVIDPQSFKQSPTGAKGLPVFAEGGEIGLLNLPFEGLVSGTKWGASIGVFAFILITGGAFGIIMATGAINRGLMRLIAKSSTLEVLAIPVLFFAFSLGGAIFGMGEEVIPFVLIIVPVFLVMGYDSITALLVTYVATQVGFACSWMNPFSVSVAQGIAGVPLLSGSGFRIVLWVAFTTLAALFTFIYAQRIKKNPQLSLAFNSDLITKKEQSSTSTLDDQVLSLGDKLVFLTLVGGIGWMIWGVTSRGYYLPEIASQFFTMGVVAAIIGIFFKLENMNANKAVEAFRHGAAQLLPAALVVAFAKGIVLMLGGDGPEQDSVLNTILHSASQSLSDLPDVLAGMFMFLFQSIFNFFVTSGSGQAALTMPLMAPLADLLGLSRQIAVLAFQLGDGLTNILVPTSAALMGCLGAARLDWGVWLRFIAWPLFVLMMLSALVMALSVLVGFS